VEANAEHSRINIKVPYIPSQLFKSYLSNYELRSGLSGSCYEKNAIINLVLYYFKVDNGFYHSFEEYVDLRTKYRSGKHSITISNNHKPLSEVLHQACMDSLNPMIRPYIYRNASPFIIFVHNKRIAFAMHRPSEILEQDYPLKTGYINPNGYRDTPNLCGIIGLIATSSGVETIPHENVYKPQLAFYDITNENHAFAIHMIFKYLSINSFGPESHYDFTQINNREINPINLTEKSNGEDDLNIKLEQSGRLIRDI
jgi:hypothetical protein